MANAVFAESAAKTLTVEESVALAVKNNYRIRNAEAEIERNRLIRQRTSNNLDFVPIGNTTENYRATLGMIQTELQWRMSQKEVDLLKDQIAYEVKRNYNEILQSEENLELAGLVVEQAQMQNRIQQTQLVHGVVSAHQKQQAENNYKEAQERYNLAQQTLEHTYEKFNDLLGISREEKRELVDVPAWEPLKNFNLTRHIATVKENSTTVWLTQQQVDIAKLDLSMYVFNDPYTYIPNPIPYDAKKIEVQKAENTVIDTQQQLESIVRSTYNNLQQLEQQYAAQEIGLDKAKQEYELIKIKYDAGMAIPLELVSAELAVTQIEGQMKDTVIQYDNLRVALEKPWLLGGR